MERKILIIGIPTHFHRTEIHAGLLMGYFLEKALGEMTIIGSTTVSDFPLEETLTSFPWETLSDYDVCVFLGSQRGELSGPSAPNRPWPILLPERITERQAKIISDFVSHGGGFVAIHSACAFITESLAKLIGGRFLSHPPLQEFMLQVEDPLHPITKDTTPFTVVDELYFIEYDPSVHVLLSTIWKGGLWTGKQTKLSWGGEMHIPDPKMLSTQWAGTWGSQNTFFDRLERKEAVQLPMAWVKPHGAGRVVYIAPGHDLRTFFNPEFLELIQRATLWASTRT